MSNEDWEAARQEAMILDAKKEERQRCIDLLKDAARRSRYAFAEGYMDAAKLLEVDNG